MMSSVTASAPGKLILSGEHAVVHGAPALAVAVNRYIKTTITGQAGLPLSLNIRALESEKTLPLCVLNKLMMEVKGHYDLYRKGKALLQDVLSDPLDLTIYTAAKMMERFKDRFHTSVQISTESTIPAHSGMGSSAASIVSTLLAMSEFFHRQLPESKFLELAKEAEHLQHGRSSGVDVTLSYKGGCLLYEKGQTYAKPIPPCELFIVHTGTPVSSTADCVRHTSAVLQDQTLLAAFNQVTATMTRALEQQDVALFKASLQRNQQLLSDIGVVPPKVQQLVADLAQKQVVAKVCGAGCIQGQGAGMLLVVGDEQQASQVLQPYGLTLEPVAVVSPLQRLAAHHPSNLQRSE